MRTIVTAELSFDACRSVLFRLFGAAHGRAVLCVVSGCAGGWATREGGRAAVHPPPADRPTARGGALPRVAHRLRRACGPAARNDCGGHAGCRDNRLAAVRRDV